MNSLAFWLVSAASAMAFGSAAFFASGEHLGIALMVGAGVFAALASISVALLLAVDYGRSGIEP